LTTAPLRSRLGSSACGVWDGTLDQDRMAEQRAEVRGEQRFQELLEAAPDGIMQVDAEGRIVLLNRVVERLFGYSRQELLGQPVEVLVPAAQRDKHMAHRDRYRERPATRPMGAALQLEGMRKDGSSFPVEISLSPAQSGEGFVVTAIIRDVTERKLAEDRLRAVQEQYTSELERQNREIERANQLKSEFLASMSHELRTPLHTIIGFSELLGEELEGPLNEKQKRFLNHIHKDSLHLLELINDILDLSKIESGRLDLRLQPFDFSAVVEESVSAVRGPILAKNIHAVMQVDVPEAVEADRLRVKQILVNLLSNAVKFTPEGGRVSLQARIDRGMVVTKVTDTGIGIRKEDHEAIFDKFYQTGTTTKGVREGTGLGLAITRHLVERHGGTIEVVSQPGKGSAFTFTIPLNRTDVPS